MGRMDPKIKWIFFDLGSTLIDETDADLHRISDMIAGTTVTLENYREKRLEMIKSGRPGDEAAISYFGLTKTPWHNEDEKLYQDTVPTLEGLKQMGFKLGVIANQTPGTQDRLSDWKILHYFDVIAASGELGIAKPDPMIFQWALGKTDCTPEETVMVGDRLDNDVAPARRLGMHTVRLLRGLGAYHEPQSPEEWPEYTVERLSDLLNLWGCGV